jgi:hypothetical protein
MPAPETVTDAVEFLRGEGYTDDLDLRAGGLHSSEEPELHAVGDVTVDYTFRFEGPSDPADEAIVLGITCPAWHRKGVVVSAYGPDIDPDHARLLQALTR